MGIFYTNITLRTDQQTIAAYLQQKQRAAYVSPTVNAYTVVFDKASEEDATELERLAVELSRALHTLAFAALVHDGDRFLYRLYEDGKLHDEFDEAPDYFVIDPIPAPPSGGNAEELCRVFGVPNALEDLRDIFDRVAKTATAEDWFEGSLVGDEIHDVLTQALRLPAFAVDTGYYSIVNEALPQDLSKDSLVFCGGQSQDESI